MTIDESIMKLMDGFSTANIAELDIQDGPLRIVFRKEAAVTTPCAAAPPVQAAGGAPAEEGRASVPVRLGIQAAPAGETSGGEIITSPIVATFYAAPGPDAPAFVRVGGKVKAGETLCSLEAMKMMNHLEAEFDCEILNIKAASGDLVEYGQALFEVRRL
jgi:acetyl-CoA carboxylase biotin carboxyl carrier protein